MSRRRSPLESSIQSAIEAAIGAESDLILMRNSVGTVKYFDEATGEPRFVTYGLGTGSPDLVGILMGRWFCLEVKTDVGRVDVEQAETHAVWRRFGALVYVVRSVDEARAALAGARALILDRGAA